MAASNCCPAHKSGSSGQPSGKQAAAATSEQRRRQAAAADTHGPAARCWRCRLSHKGGTEGSLRPKPRPCRHTAFERGVSWWQPAGWGGGFTVGAVCRAD